MVLRQPQVPLQQTITHGEENPNSFHLSSIKNLVLIKLVSTPAASFTWEGEQLYERPNSNKFLVGKITFWVQQAREAPSHTG